MKLPARAAALSDSVRTGERAPKLAHVAASRPQSLAACCLVYQFARAALTEQHKLSGLSNRNSLSHSSGSWKSKIRVSARFVPSEASPLGL